MTWSPVPDFPGLSVRLTPNADGRIVITGLHLEADAVTAEMVRSIKVGMIERAANYGGTPDKDLPPLRRKPGTSPEEFSRLVADHYRRWAATHPNPGAVMAERSGVKAPTVHTWIREARLRGFLPPARRGKA